jgi:hypothetical protein
VVGVDSLVRPGWWLDADGCPGGRGGLREGVDAELGVHVLEVFLDGARRDAHPGGGLRGGMADGG